MPAEPPAPPRRVEASAPAAAPPPPPPPAEAPPAALDGPADLWRQAIVRVKERKLLLGTCLEEGSFLGASGGSVRVALAPEHSFHKAMLEMKENREILNQEFEIVFGRGIAFSCVISAEGGAATPQNRIRAELLAEAADQADSQMDEPEPPAAVVKRIVEIFDGEILGRAQDADEPEARGSGAA